MSTFVPYPWKEFPFECLWYLLPMGVVHLVIFVVGCVILAALAFKHRGTFLKQVARFGFFLALLLVVGSLFNGLWSCLVWGRFYHHPDYVFDFSPFWPITQMRIDTPNFGDRRGELIGVSLFQLNLIWLIFALGTWGISAFLFRKLLKGKQLSG